MIKKVLLSLLGIVFLTNIIAQEVVQHFEIEAPTMELTEDAYTNVLYDDAASWGEEGSPLLPYLSFEILLPQGKEIKQLNILSKEFYPLQENIVLQPASNMFPIHQQAGDYKVSPNAKIYSSGNVYPESQLKQYETHFLKGYSIATVLICPVEWIPAEKSFKTLKSLSISIETKDIDRGNTNVRSLRTNPETKERLEVMLENPEMIRSYPDNTRDVDDIDILLISNNELLPGFDTYIDYKTSTGYVVEAVSIENIYNDYTGVDRAEKVRNCIIDYYDNHGIDYVILGGDTDGQLPSQAVVPHRGFAVLDDDAMPSDMYFSNLDGNWNNDGDDYWGEQGEIDLYAEVFVGRICVDNSTEVANALNKHIKYQNEPVTADVQKALMIGEELNNNPQTNGGDYKDEIADGGSYNGYYTHPIDPEWEINYLYERDMNWGKSSVYNMFNNTGVNLLNHLGHSSPTYNMKLNNSDLTTSNFTNDGVTRSYVIGYSQGCYNGCFDNLHWEGYYTQDCFAEKITTIETAEVASIANSRYGWYSPGGTNSSSQYYDRMFFDAIFGDGISMIGKVNQLSKEVNASYISSESYYRWVAYEANLFGDPTLDIWTAQPVDITASYQSAIPLGTQYISFQTDAPFARIGLMQDGELIGRAVADDNGNAEVELFNLITSNSDVQLSIIGHNKNRLQDVITIINNVPYVIFNTCTIDDSQGNANGQADYGESLMLNVELQNVGDQPATGLTATISCSDPYINITDDNEDYPDIAAGATANVNQAFAVDVAQDVPDDYVIHFDLLVSGADNWESVFEITAFAAELQCQHFSIDDAAGGNGNNRLDAGETVDIMISLINNGHSLSPDISASLASVSSYLDITNANYTASGLAAGEALDATFSLSVDAGAPTGEYVILDFEVDAGIIHLEQSYGTKIGLVAEDWESGDFSMYDWSFMGNAPWNVTDEDPYEGQYCARSGEIGNGNMSHLILDYSAAEDDSISFYRKISSESGGDYLTFYIDNSQQGSWSGEEGWERVSFPVSAGDHTFRWIYLKNSSGSNGEDCAWLDMIELPKAPTTTAYAGPDTLICANWVYQAFGEAAFYESLEWASSGSGEFSENNILNPVYTPSQEDIDNGSVILSLTAFGPGDYSVSDEMTLTIDPCTGIMDMNEFSINIYPNPGSGSFSIEGLPENADLLVYNQASALIKTLSYNDNSGVFVLKLDGLSPGVYYLQIRSDANTVFKKLLIQ